MALHLERDDREWTYEDYLQLPDDGNRYEIIDGRLYVSPAPSPYHQTLSRRVQFWFYPLELAGQGQIFNAPVDLLMAGATPVQPDLVFLGPEQASMITRRALEGVPTLVVEILSASTAGRDRTIKCHKYASCGVPHYWILDPFARTLEMYRLVEGHYRLERALGEHDRYECADFPGVVVDMAALFAGIPRLD
ncbi:MAG: Uma2 family endonuclease [Candidatus Eremiobacterota bacterium]